MMQKLTLIMLGLTAVLCSGMQTQSSTLLRADEQMMNELLIHRVDPVCPAFAKKKNIPCEAKVSLRVDIHGHVTKAKMIEGNAILKTVAEAAAKQWRYVPYILAGSPVEVETSAQLHFKK